MNYFKLIKIIFYNNTKQMLSTYNAGIRNL